MLEKHKGTFCRLENKRIPAHLDWFGWCTWDAFYTEVSPQGIKEGLQRYTSNTIYTILSTNFTYVMDSLQIF